MKKSRLFGITAVAAPALLVSGLTACAPPETKSEGEQTQSGVNAAEATSAEDFGGMDGLVEAAKKKAS
jgi:putative spermidine/putrescine transport system substrate-binding protein